MRTTSLPLKWSILTTRWRWGGQSRPVERGKRNGEVVMMAMLVIIPLYHNKMLAYQNDSDGIEPKMDQDEDMNWKLLTLNQERIKHWLQLMPAMMERRMFNVLGRIAWSQVAELNWSNFPKYWCARSLCEVLATSHSRVFNGHLQMVFGDTFSKHWRGDVQWIQRRAAKCFFQKARLWETGKTRESCSTIGSFHDHYPKYIQSIWRFHDHYPKYMEVS